MDDQKVNLGFSAPDDDVEHEAVATFAGYGARGMPAKTDHGEEPSDRSVMGPDSFFAGSPAARVLEVAEPLSEGRPVDWRSLGAEFQPVSLAEARSLGLPESVARGVADREPRERRLLSVRRRTAGTAAAELLEDGDLLLSLDGRVAPAVPRRETGRKPGLRP